MMIHAETIMMIVAVLTVGVWGLACCRWNHLAKIMRSYWVLWRLKRIAHPARQFSYLRRIDPLLFEEVVLSALKKTGCRIKRNRRYTGDGGCDGQCWIGEASYLLQVKRYASYINPQQVKSFNQLCRFRQQRGLFVHTGKTGPASKGLQNSVVKIVSGDRLLTLLVQGKWPC